MTDPQPAHEPTAAQLAFVDEVAVFFADEGLPHISGQVIGWLLICDPPEQSPAELAQVLGVSRSSISTAIRLLIPSGLVERVHRRGQRQQYLRIAADGWSRMLQRRYGRAAAFREVTARGLAVLDDEGAASSTRERLANVHDLYAFLEDELPALIQRWRNAGGQDDTS